MNKKVFTVWLISSLCFTGLWGQSDDFGVWSSVEVQKKISPGFNVSLEGELRTRSGLKDVERWMTTIDMAYRLNAYLKADAGYTYIYSHQPEETTKKGNKIADYWSPRHRLSASLTGSYVWKRIEFSLRERYQFTHRTALSVSKYDGDDGSRKTDEEITAKSKNVLRSRLQAVWNIKKSAFNPYASCELYNSITDGWGLDKMRWTAGTVYRINKRHSLDFFYRYQDQTDDDEQSGHVLGAGYKLKF